MESAFLLKVEFVDEPLVPLPHEHIGVGAAPGAQDKDARFIDNEHIPVLPKLKGTLFSSFPYSCICRIGIASTRPGARRMMALPCKAGGKMLLRIPDKARWVKCRLLFQIPPSILMSWRASSYVKSARRRRDLSNLYPCFSVSLPVASLSKAKRSLHSELFCFSAHDQVACQQLRRRRAVST